MPRYKSRPTIVPWLSAKPDNRERRFIQVGDSLLFSKAFRELHVGARYLFFSMDMESGGKRDFRLPTAAAGKYGIAPSSFWTYVRELEDKRFIVCRSNKHLRRPNDYSFSDEWKTISQAPINRPEAMATCSRSDRNPNSGNMGSPSLVDQVLESIHGKDAFSCPKSG